MSVDAVEKRQSQSQIEEQINMLVASRERLSDRLTNLSSRLSSVIRDEQPTENKGSEPDEQLVSIATSIREIRYYIESDTRQIMSILDRLEIP